MHQGADPSHRFCTLYGCRVAASVGGRSCSATLAPVSRDPVEPRPIIREVSRVERLAYTRTQAAEALGISRSTLNRLLPFLEIVELPWGTKLVPVDELERLLRERRSARRRPEPATPGRPRALPPELVRQIRVRAGGGQEPRFDRRRSERQRHADGARRSALVAVDGAGRSATAESGLTQGRFSCTFRIKWGGPFAL